MLKRPRLLTFEIILMVKKLKKIEFNYMKILFLLKILLNFLLQFLLIMLILILEIKEIDL